MGRTLSIARRRCFAPDGLQEATASENSLVVSKGFSRISDRGDRLPSSCTSHETTTNEVRPAAVLRAGGNELEIPPPRLALRSGELGEDELSVEPRSCS